MPRVWGQTVEEHHQLVHDAVVEATARLAREQGIAGVTMTQVAQAARIGRATLYRYFPDVSSILTAWHRKQVDAHLVRLEAADDPNQDARQRLVDVLTEFARIQSERHDLQRALEITPDLVSHLHAAHSSHPHATRAHQLIDRRLRSARAAGAIRDDVPVSELTRFVVGALESAATARGPAAIERLVRLTMSALEPADSSRR